MCLIVKSIINMSSISLTFKIFGILYLPEPEYSLAVGECFSVLLLQVLQQLVNQISVHADISGIFETSLSNSREKEKIFQYFFWNFIQTLN